MPWRGSYAVALVLTHHTPIQTFPILGERLLAVETKLENSKRMIYWLSLTINHPLIKLDRKAYTCVGHIKKDRRS